MSRQQRATGTTHLAVLAVAVTVLVSILVAGCANPLVGTWQSNGGVTYQFESDGTVLVTYAGMEGYVETGRYDIVGSGMLRLSFGVLSYEMPYTLEGNTLTLIRLGQAKTYIKVGG